MRSDAAVALRPATAGDLPACAAILNAWIDETAWIPRIHPPDDLAGHLRDAVWPVRDVLVAERDGAVAGFIVLGPEGFVASLFVAPGARGAGVGTALVAAAKARHPAGLVLWTFAANAPARDFYARHGFAEVRRTPGENDEGLPDILLAWRGAA